MATLLSRREAMTALLGASPCLRAAMAPAESDAPVRLALSETLVGDVNLNDARAAMQIWLKRMTANLSVVISPKLFSTTPEIVEGIRKGLIDAVALNVIEYRQIADLLDSGQILNGVGDGGLEQYLLLVKEKSPFKHLADLKGCRLTALKTPKMCMGPVWLSTILDEGHQRPAEQFFGSMSTDLKFSRVVLPVFFGQADCCLTSMRGFETMCELNPQVGKELTVIARSPVMVVSFYIFRKNFRNAQREKMIRAISNLGSSSSGQELAMLFQFDQLALRDGSSLAIPMKILDAADRARGMGRK